MSKDKAEKLLAAGSEPFNHIEGLVSELIASKEPYCRSAVAIALGARNERCRFPLLIQLLSDSNMYVRGDAIISLGNLGDSRALFPLVNYFKNAPYELQLRIINSLAIMKDLRSSEFLSDISKVADIKTYAIDVLKSLAIDDMYPYRFAGSDSDWETAKQKGSCIKLNCSNDLTSIADVLNDEWFQKHPQTYVVTLDKKLRIGGWVEEHVRVARGEDVLAAGEIRFIQTKNGWEVTFVNNRSNGYYPHHSCLRWVEEAIKKTDIIPLEYNLYTLWRPLEGFNDPDFLEHQPLFNYHESP